MAAEDQALLHAIFTQPGVRHFVFDRTVIPPPTTSGIIEKSQSLSAERGFGLWLARLVQSDEALGFGGFWYFRDPAELELLYGVADDRVGHGYGREIARAVIDYGIDVLKMPAIRASYDAGHEASRRLLEALGFRFEREAVVNGLATMFYEKTP